MKFLKTLSVFVGTIIGVGIFGLPYIASLSGFYVVIVYFLLMSVVAVAIHLLLGEVAAGTEGNYRLPGYVGKYLGDRWKNISLLTLGLGVAGALLAYLIVGGEFLHFFFSPYFGGSNLIYTLLFFGAGTFLVFRGIKSIAKIELLLLVVFFVILAIFFTKAFPFIDPSNFQNFNFEFITLPYWIVLFSLWGLALVPELNEMLGGRKKPLRKVIISGILLSAITYLVFIFVIFGASGSNTSKEGISGLAGVLGDGVIRLGFLFGIITCFTSFITLALTFKKILWYDFNVPKNISWFLACFSPLLLFFLKLGDFIDIISLTGAFAIGFEAIIVIFLYKEFLKRKFSAKMNPAIYLLVAFFLLGLASEIFYFGLVK